MPPLFGFGAGLNIPAGKSDYVIIVSLTLPIDVLTHGLYAHAHYIAKDIKATATLHDGTAKPLVWIRDWDFNWQDPYMYISAAWGNRRAVRRRPGTVVSLRIKAAEFAF